MDEFEYEIVYLDIDPDRIVYNGRHRLEAARRAELSKDETGEEMVNRIISDHAREERERRLRPAHRSYETYTRGKVRLTCICGWQSSLQDEGEKLTVEDEYRKHLHLRESERYSN